MLTKVEIFYPRSNAQRLLDSFLNEIVPSALTQRDFLVDIKFMNSIPAGAQRGLNQQVDGMRNEDLLVPPAWLYVDACVYAYISCVSTMTPHSYFATHCAARYVRK